MLSPAYTCTIPQNNIVDPFCWFVSAGRKMSKHSSFLRNNLFSLIFNSPVALTVIGAVLGVLICSFVSPLLTTKCSSFWVGRPIVAVGTSPLSHDASQPRNMVLKSSRTKMFADMPSHHEKYFYAPCSKNCHPMIRALRVLGWDKVNTIEEGRLIFSHKQANEFHDELKSWQRFNHISNSEAWHDLTMQTAGWKAYTTKTGKWPYFVPESYSLNRDEDRKALSIRIKSGLKENWSVIQEGDKDEAHTITHLAAGSKELFLFSKNQIGSIKNKKKIDATILQSFVCNPLTWKKRKIAIRSFWMIASMDPLIVLYQDGYARHGYSDSNLFKTTKDYYEAPLPRFEEEMLRPYVRGRGRRKFNKDIQKQPLAHIRSQLKESIATLVDAFRSPTTFQPSKLAEDGFAYYVTDSYLDEDLNIWLAKAYNETKIPEDRYFLLETNHNVFYGMGKVLTEIWEKQARGESILPLQHGNGWQLVYAADNSDDNKWMYQYIGYERKVKRSCRIRLIDKDTEEVEYHGEEVMKSR